MTVTTPPTNQPPAPGLTPHQAGSGPARVATTDPSLVFKNDPRQFIEMFFWIVNKDRERVPFKFNEVQSRLYNARSGYDLVLKARKEGISSMIEAIMLTKCLFLQNRRAVVVTHDLDSSKRHFEKIRYFIDNMSAGDLKIKIDLDTATQKQLSIPQTNSSYWIGTAGSKAFGRGDDITDLHLSEVPHWKDQSILTGLLEACVPSAWRVLESTANGVGEAFERLWEASKDSTQHSPWKRHFFAWFEDVEYRSAIPEGVAMHLNGQEKSMKKDHGLSLEQVLWYRQKKASMPEKGLMPQEYPCDDQEAFLSSGRHVFDQRTLRVLVNRVTDPVWVGDLEDDGSEIELMESTEGKLHIWKRPREQRKYLICADVAEGLAGGDWSVAHVIDRASWEQVAMWRGHVDAGKFGKVMVDMGYFYNNAVLVPENNNHGWGTIERIKTEDYPHLLHTDELWPEGGVSKPGFPTNEKTKELSFVALRNSVDDYTVNLNSLLTVREMRTVVRDKTGKIVAEPGCYKDTVSALAIGIYCLKFLTVNETYAKRHGGRVDPDAPLSVQYIGGKKPEQREHKRPRLYV